MNEDDVICEIKWTVADVKTAFLIKHGCEPTEEQLQNCVNNVNEKALKDFSISYGWDFINEAII